MSYYSPSNRGYGFGGLSLKNLESEFNQLFGKLPTLLECSDFAGDANKRSVTKASWFENEEAYEGRLDLPGVKTSDVDIEIEDRQLKVRAIRKTGDEKESSNVEYSYRQLLPEGVDSEAVSARMDDGILSLRVPKAEKAKPRRIEVN